MVLFPYQRLAYLFDTIRSDILPQDELAKRFSVSTRTIRTDVTIINEALESYGAKIMYERGNGYRLLIEDEHLFGSLPNLEQQMKPIPRTAKERVHSLLLRFLMSSTPIKLEEIADEWFIGRGSLQQDMTEVKEHFSKYQLFLEKKARYGMKLVGTEAAIRSCITDILWQMFANENNRAVKLLEQELLNNVDLNYIKKVVQNSFERFEIKLTQEAKQYFIFNCAVSIVRITTGHELFNFEGHEIEHEICKAAEEIAHGFIYFLGNEVSSAEKNYLCVQIAARSIPYHSAKKRDEENVEQLVEHILTYINNSYNYDLRSDKKLIKDLVNHLTSMITRVKYQVTTPNPLLEDIKKYYPFAYDVTLSAMANIEEYIPYEITEDEIGYLAVHIGVGLERNYNIGYERHPHVLIVSDSANSTLRMIEAKILRHYPQIVVEHVISLKEYEELLQVEQDFIITTVRLVEKNKPIVKVAPFPTPYQLEQIGRLVMVDRTRPYMLERFFDEKHFMLIKGRISQQALFKRVCQQLETEGFIKADFYPSLVEREAIVSTMLGESIAIPHSLGLLAQKTIVVTILAPDGIVWSKEKEEVANVIFLLAISKDEYEEAMTIYDLFVTFVREKATKRLLNSKNFQDFQAIAKDSLVRSV